MGDRVAIIGGKTAGRDHFPFSVPDAVQWYDLGNSLDPLYFPIALDVSAACRWYWLVKTWGVTISLSLTDTDGHGTTSFTGTAVTLSNDPALSASRESDLVSADIYPGQFVNRFAYDGSASGSSAFHITPPGDATAVSSSIACELALFSLIDYPSILWSGALYPQLLFSIGASVSYTGGDAMNHHGSVSLSSVFDVGTSFSGSIDGVTLPIKGLVSGAATLTFSISPIEYWPYADKNGDPVYDTTTGAQLRDPLG